MSSCLRGSLSYAAMVMSWDSVAAGRGAGGWSGLPGPSTSTRSYAGLVFEADANWWVSSDQARQGLGTEGVTAMIEYALRDLPHGLGLQRVMAAIMPSNAAGISLARQRGAAARQCTGKVSIRTGDRWELHEMYERSAPVAMSIGA